MVFWLLIGGCVRYVCVQPEVEEEGYGSVSLSRTFLFDSFDQNQDKRVSVEEYRERIAVRFGFLDTDGSGKIELGRECRDNPWCTSALSKGRSSLTLGHFLDDAMVRFDAVDRNGDRHLERKEFSKIPGDKS